MTLPPTFATEQNWARGLALATPTQLGWTPIPIQAAFSMGQDWIVTLEAVGTTIVFPAGTVITAYIYPASTNTSQPIGSWVPQFTWIATITGNTVYIKAPYSQTDQVPAGSLIRIMVSLPDTPTNDNYVWAAGIVVRND